jgi:hypothetical protein
MFGYHGVNHLAREKGVQGDPNKNRFEVGLFGSPTLSTKAVERRVVATL